MDFLNGGRKDEKNRSKQSSREMVSMPPGNAWVAPPGGLSLTAESVEGKMYNFSVFYSAPSPNSKAEMQSGVSSFRAP